MAELTIVIVSYNAKDALARCLASLHASPPAVDHEIVVVDNASSDGAPDVVRGWPDVRLIEAGANLGFAAATNLGIRATQGRLVLLLNPDTEVPPGALDRLVDVLDRHPGVTVVGPRIVGPDGAVEVSTGTTPGLVAEVARRRLNARLARRHPRTIASVERRFSREHRPGWVTGACLLVRRADALAVGLFDERYFLYYEDVAFCTAVRRAGGQVLFTPDVEVRHHRGASTAADPGVAARHHTESHVAYYELNRPWLAPLVRRMTRRRP